MFLQKNAGRNNHRKLLSQLIEESELSVLCSGWLKSSGLTHILPSIDLALKSQAKLTIFSNSKHTEQSVIDTLLQRPGVKHFIIDNNSRYLHSKIYHFEKESLYKTIIGSANITDGGLTSNEELSVKLSGTLYDAQHKQIKAYLEELYLLASQ